MSTQPLVFFNNASDSIQELKENCAIEQGDIFCEFDGSELLL